jgi:hypothetical protein
MLDLNRPKFTGESFAPPGYAVAVDADSTADDLLRVAAATAVVLSAAERLDADIVDEATLAELLELHDRAQRALSRIEQPSDVR